MKRSTCPFCHEPMLFGFHQSSVTAGLWAGIATWLVVFIAGMLLIAR